MFLGPPEVTGAPVLPRQYMRTRHIVWLVALLTSTSAPVTAQATSASPLAMRVDSLATAYFAVRRDLSPGVAVNPWLRDARRTRVRDNSLEALRRVQARYDTLRSAVLALDPAPIAGRPQWVTYGVLRERLDAEYALRICHLELWAVSSWANGWQVEAAELAQAQPVGNAILRAQALDRAQALPRFLDNEIENLREGLRRGFSAPKVVVRNVLAQLADLLDVPVERSPFASPALRDGTPAFRVTLFRIVRSEINPAIARYRDFLEAEYLPRARESLGVASNPSGGACYRASIRSFASVEIAPESVYALGTRQMARAERQMRTIAARSFGGESLGTLFARLRSEPRYTFRSGRELMDTSRAALQRARAAMAGWFGRVPAADVVIRPYPESRQKAGAPGQYVGPEDDGPRPGVFLINLLEPEKRPRADAENIAFHETIPGHHLQVAIARERYDLHPISRFTSNSGFAEGWALYAERLADEMGLYSSDVGRLGMLASESFRAARMVIDVGIHTHGWTRQQAIDFLSAHTVLVGRNAEAEVDRYISWPGQSPAYMIGRMEIVRLRARAQRALGVHFDIREFHDHVLENGSVPLALLRANVERWIATAR
jgi:uncharacterized protein (DUF885 family)